MSLLVSKPAGKRNETKFFARRSSSLGNGLPNAVQLDEELLERVGRLVGLHRRRRRGTGRRPDACRTRTRRRRRSRASRAGSGSTATRTSRRGSCSSPGLESSRASNVATPTHPIRICDWAAPGLSIRYTCRFAALWRRRQLDVRDGAGWRLPGSELRFEERQHAIRRDVAHHEQGRVVRPEHRAVERSHVIGRERGHGLGRAELRRAVPMRRACTVRAGTPPS